MIQEKDITLDIIKIKNLPPLPAESLRIISAVNDPDISIQSLVDAISFMPSLTARLLGLANSAYFGRAVEITDLRIAIIQVLGVNLVKSLALSLALSDELNTSKCKSFDADYFWSHALFTALGAQKLAIKINDNQIEPNTAYSSGLLLNIGLLAAVYVAPKELNQIFSNTDRIEGNVSAQMLKKFGQTQYGLGGVLLERWKLPRIYQTIVKQFKHKEYQGEQKKLILLLELCHWMGAYIATDNVEEMPEFLDILKPLSLSLGMFSAIVEEIVDSKENITELASIIGN